jgi:hypothetical protein
MQNANRMSRKGLLNGNQKKIQTKGRKNQGRPLKKLPVVSDRKVSAGGRTP